MNSDLCPDCGETLHYADGEPYCPVCVEVQADYEAVSSAEPMLCPTCNVPMVHGGRDDYGGDMDAVCDHYCCEKCDYTTEQNCVEDWEFEDGDYDPDYDADEDDFDYDY